MIVGSSTGFAVGQRTVGIVGRQVALPHLLEHRDRGGPTDLLQPDVARLVGRLLRGVTEYERRGRKHLELVGVSTARRSALLDVGVVPLPRVQRRVQREQRVGMLGAERAPVVGVAGLQQDGLRLRRRRQGGHAADVELRPGVRDAADPAGVDVDAALCVGDHGVGCPAVPELACDRDEFIGARVALGVVEEAAATEVLAGERIGRGDHVPARTAVGQMVERRELPCHLEGFVQRGVDRADQSEPPGDGGQRRQHGERVGPSDDVEVVEPAAVLAQSQPLGEEEEVEEPTLGGALSVTHRGDHRLADKLETLHRDAVRR